MQYDCFRTKPNVHRNCSFFHIRRRNRNRNRNSVDLYPAYKEQQFSAVNISQASVVMHLRRMGSYITTLLQISCRVLKINTYLLKIWTTVWRLIFLTHGAHYCHQKCGPYIATLINLFYVRPFTNVCTRTIFELLTEISSFTQCMQLINMLPHHSLLAGRYRKVTGLINNT